MGKVIATCGHTLQPKEGLGEPMYLYDGGQVSWVVYCKACQLRLTPVYMELETMNELPQERLE